MRQRKDLAGRRFGMLTAISRADTARQPSWHCQCDCGTERSFRISHLLSGRSSSCGCFRTSTEGRRSWETHGDSGSREYQIWMLMKQRCQNPGSTPYPYYGGRGIKVCTRWETYENFLADMGRCPPGLTIDRKDNDGDYEPDNCRWADRKTQRANRRDSQQHTLGAAP